MSKKILALTILAAMLFALGSVVPDFPGISTAHARSLGIRGGSSRVFSGTPKAGAPAPAPKASTRSPPTKSTGMGSKYGGAATGAAVGTVAGTATAHTATPAPIHETAPAGGEYGGIGGAPAPGGSTPIKAAATQPPKSPAQQTLDKAVQKADSGAALAQYLQQQQRFKTQAKVDHVPSGQERQTVDAIKSRVRYRNPKDYYVRRDAFYAHHNNWQPPAYAYNAPSSFGIWDAAFLWLMLDNVGEHSDESQYRDFYYAHKDDPGMQDFRKEVEKLSADNAELKAQIAALDASAEKLKNAGKPVDPSYVPLDAVDVALAACRGKRNSRRGIWELLLGLVVAGNSHARWWVSVHEKSSQIEG